MVETTTQHYGWTKPELQHSPTTWGQFINTDLDSIDAHVWSNQQGIVPIGAMSMWPTATPPTNWLLCNGQSLVHATGGAYEALFQVIGYTFGGSGGNFNVPNLTQKFPFGAAPAGGNPIGQTGGSFSYTIGTANLPAHSHLITDVSHNHSYSQTPHGHADTGHTHTATQPAHTHTVGGTSGSAGSGFAAGAGSQVATTTTSSAQPSITVSPTAANSLGIQGSLANINFVASMTGITTTQSVGSGTPMSIVQPYIAIYFIIRYT